jgi:predicted choloylglycine hydrolase
MLNCSYELSHLYIPKIFGCTAGVRHVEGRGMVHVRTLDWQLPSIGNATCIFRFHKGGREFFAVGVPGMVGVLSGMVPGGYSVTINWAPPAGWPNWNWGPTFFLRHVLETCNTYAEAVKMLRDTPLSTSVFFTICGIEPGEGCVIERTKNQAVVRELTDGTVTQANHHEAECFAHNNSRIALLEEAEFAQESVTRAALLKTSLGEHDTTRDIAGVLDLPPVLNAETVQKMVFCPRTGEVSVWRRISE